MKKLMLIIFLALVSMLNILNSCKPVPGGPVSKSTNTVTPTLTLDVYFSFTPTNTNVASDITPTFTDTEKIILTPTYTSTEKDIFTYTYTATSTYTPTERDTNTPTYTSTERETLTYTTTPTYTLTERDTLTQTATHTITSTPTVTSTCVKYYLDNDSDGFGQTNQWQCLTSPSGNYTALIGGDCDDNNALVNPYAMESCNGKDDDCDGLIDEENANGCVNFYMDLDSDGYGTIFDYKCLCQPSSFYTASVAGDCNDVNPQINPGHPEICSNGFDDNCDGQVDEPNCQ